MQASPPQTKLTPSPRQPVGRGVPALIFPIEQFLPFAIVVSIGVFTQATTGFAGGLVILPLMLWAGHGIPEAQAAMLTATVPQNLWGVYQFRATIKARALILPTSLRFVALPIGIAVLHRVDGLPMDQIRQLVGAVVITCVTLLLVLRPKPRKDLPTGWTFVAFLASGFFAGLTGTGGPMMVLWVQAHDWSTERSRAFLFSMYLLTIPVAFALLFVAFGDRILRATLSAALLIPLLVLVSHFGLRLGTRLGRERLRAITMVILLVIGVLGLLAPAFSHGR